MWVIVSGLNMQPISNPTVNTAPFGRSDLPQAAGRLPSRWAYHMRIRILTFALLFCSLANGACANPFGERIYFQGLDVGNDGKSHIENVSVLYGKVELIRGPARASFSAGNVALNRFHQGMDSPIPEMTLAYWETDDGIPHSAIIPTKSLVRDTDVFYGFRFYIVDDHVDIYLTERIPTPGPYLNLKYTKVFSAVAAQPTAPEGRFAGKPAARP